MSEHDEQRPRRVMVAVAHPDDAEFGCAGTVARWAAEGQEIIFVLGTSGDKGSDDPLGQCDCPVLQVVFATQPREDWAGGTRGLNPRDLAIAVALPEIDGRIMTRAVAFTSSGTLAAGLPSGCSASAWKPIFWLAETQPSVLMPATTPAGQTVCTLRSVWTSPFGSA